MEVLSIAVFCLLVVVYVFTLAVYNDLFNFILGSVFVVFFIYGVEAGSYQTDNTASTKEKVIVSVAPPQQEIKGSVSGNFLFFSGTIGQETFYLLRERVNENTYLDFKVVNGAYIVEDNTLTNEGKFIQVFNCYNNHHTYRVLWWEVIHKVVYECDFIKQSIVVPQGTVIKNMNGI